MARRPPPSPPPAPTPAAAARLDAEGWAAPITILCRRSGLVCECGSSSYRTRREGTAARPALMRVRCEGCGAGGLVDPADPAAELAEVDGRPLVAEQAALF